MKITAGNTQLFWDKENKKFYTPTKYYYDISECPTLTFTDDSKRFGFELRIDGLKVTVKPIYVNCKCKFEFKDILELKVYNLYGTVFYKNIIYLGQGESTYTFKSKKQLTKFIGRLCRVTEITSCTQ